MSCREKNDGKPVDFPRAMIEKNHLMHQNVPFEPVIHNEKKGLTTIFAFEKK